MTWKRGQFAEVGEVAVVPLVHAAVVGAAPLDGAVNVGFGTFVADRLVVRPVACDHAYVSAPPSGFETVAPSVTVSPTVGFVEGVLVTAETVGVVAVTPMLTESAVVLVPPYGSATVRANVIACG